MRDLSTAIGKQVRSQRHSQGISLEELAFKAGLNAAHLGQIERGLRNPTIETLEKIAIALEVSFSSLIPTEELESPPSQSKTEQASVLRKIDAQLSSMTLEEQKDILHIIRIFRRHSKHGTKKAD